MDDVERLERIQALLDELNDMRGTHIILVEGLKDVASLRHVGVDGEFFCVQSGGGPVKAAEHVWHSGMQAVIMTDWDRRGGSLARSLRENLSALDVRYDDRIRGELAVLCRPYAKDVESVDAVVLILQRSCGLSRWRTEGRCLRTVRPGRRGPRQCLFQRCVSTWDERSLHRVRGYRRSGEVHRLPQGRQ